MSRRKVTDDGLVIAHRGKGDHRVYTGNVGARTEPKFPKGDVSLWRFEDGVKFTMFLPIEDLADLYACIVELLDHIDEREHVLSVALDARDAMRRSAGAGKAQKLSEAYARESAEREMRTQRGNGG